MRIILLIAICILNISVYAQKQAYHWYFGNNTGLDFSVTRTLTSSNLGSILGVPTEVTGPIKTGEGCFSISDRDGNFLFASDGITVYNKNLAVMPNGTGLMGDPSATQSGIVIPVPGSSTRFYIVTAPAVNNGTNNGIRYSLLDMSLQGGLGDVTATKNVLLSYGTSGYGITDTYENITVVGHNNGTDFWLVSRIRGKFLVWKITASGFSTPQVFNIGIDLGVHPTIDRAGIGSIKLSPDGSKVIHMDFSQGTYLTIGDFNSETGAITNIQSIKTGIKGLYGIEFSPSGKYVYMSGIEGSMGLYIKPVSNLNPPYIKAVSNIVNVQLGSDNRIYGISDPYTPVPLSDNLSLWIILDPDDGGTKIAKFNNFFRSTNTPTRGLPPFITSFFNIKPIVGKSLVCVGNDAAYSVEIPSIGSGTQQIAYLEWNFGDGTPVVKDYNMSASVTTYKQIHKYENKGVYTIRVTPYLVNGLPENSKITTIASTIAECKIVTNKMIRSDLLPN